MKDFFLLDNSISSVSRTKICTSTSIGGFFSALFDDGHPKTEDYYAIRKTTDGYTVKYYLTKFYEIYRSNWWSITIHLNDEIGEHFNKISNACNWNYLFTEDSLKRAFRKFPNIYNAFINKNSSISYSSFISNHLTKFIHKDYLSEYEEKEAVEELCKTAIDILKELVSFKIDINDLVRKETKNQSIVLPSWIRDGVNIAVRVGVKTLAAYIGANIDSNFEIGNIDGDINVDVPDFDSNFDIDIDLDSDLSTFFENNNGIENQYNISFGAQSATLDRSGGGLGSLDVTITKEPGTSNQFCITDKFGHVIHNVSGTANKIKINGIWYKLPDLKG